jgi:hypothetical protein
MGNDRRYKGLLLDEADFPLPRDCDMQTLEQAVEDFCEAEFRNEYDHPYLEIYGVASEGFDAVSTYPFYANRTAWIKPDRGFREIFIQLAGDLDIPEALAAEAIDTGRATKVETHLKDRVRDHLDDQDYYTAQKLVNCLPGLRSHGLPGVKDAGKFDTRGEDMIVDYRVENYGPGRRILVELVFDWGQ